MTQLTLQAIGDTILASHHNQAYNLLKGVAGSGEAVTLLSELRVGASNWATTGTIRGTHGLSIVSRNNANSADRRLIGYGVEGTDTINIGDSGVAGTIWLNGTLKVPGFGIAATSGDINVRNSTTIIAARNAANTADIPVIGTTSGDVIKIAEFGQQVTMSGNLVLNATFLSVGTTPATTGTVRVPKGATGDFLVARNNANSGNLSIIGADTSDIVYIYDSALPGLRIHRTKTADASGHLAASARYWAGD